MAPLLCPLLSCTSPVPPTRTPTLQADILTHLRNDHNIPIPHPVPRDLLTALRQRQQSTWNTRRTAVNERLDEKQALRYAQWKAYAADPSLGVPTEVDCEAEQVALAVLAEVDWDDEVEEVDLGEQKGPEVVDEWGEREIRNVAETKDKVERLVRFLEDAVAEEAGDGDGDLDGDGVRGGNEVRFGVRKFRQGSPEAGGSEKRDSKAAKAVEEGRWRAFPAATVPWDRDVVMRDGDLSEFLGRG